MSVEKELRQKIAAYQEAQQVVALWLTGSGASSLLQKAFDCGIFDLVAATPTTEAQLALALDLPLQLVQDLCAALVAHAIFELEDHQLYKLTRAFEVLAAPTTAKSLKASVNYATVMHRLVGQLGSTTNFWQLAKADKLAIARGTSVNPASPVFQALSWNVMSSQMPELHQLLVSGCNHLELGCGVGGGLLGLVCTYPKITAVGVELDADILAEAQDNAIKLGEAVYSRVRWREIDAAKLEDAAAFDSIFWSQSFFPLSSRGEVIKAAFRALKPGGYLYAPAEAEVAVKAIKSVANQQQSLHRLVYSSWGMTGLSQSALQLELEAAGFELVRVVTNPANQGLLLRSPCP